MANVLRKIWMIGTFVLMCALATLAQNGFNLFIKASDIDTAMLRTQAPIQQRFASRLQLQEYISRLPAQLQAKGFIAASVDSIYENAQGTIVNLYLGKQYQWSKIQIDDKDLVWLKNARVPSETFAGKAFNFMAYQQAQEKMLHYFERNGYPFSAISLDSIIIEEEKIFAKLQIDKGVPYRIDSIRLMGPAKISRNFVYRYLDIAKGSLYNKDKLDKINQRLQELPYLQQMQPWDITMLSTASLVNLYLQPRKSNQINVLAGFLPANDQLGGKLLFTIDANLQLQNAFGSGEKIGLVWQQIQPKSPRLHLNYTQPYLFNSPYGVDFLFDLYKRDSSFLNINGQLGLLYALSPNKTGKVIIHSLRTNVLEIDTFQIKASKRLPQVADVSLLNLGVHYDVVNTNYKFNPTKGVEYSVYAGVGNKTIRKNNTIVQLKDPNFNFEKLYDSVKLKTYQIRLKAAAAKYFPVGKQSVIKTGISGGWIESPNYFQNELFQIGGYKLLRGFDEESIFANQYVVGTIEYRYLLGQNSNFFVFSDFGYSQNKIIQKSYNYIGAGLGLSFETKAGIFNISYAAGKRNDLNFDIKQAKIHLGYVSVF